MHFEDFHAGQTFRFGGYEVTAEEIKTFAREWDPQPHHLDEEAAKETILGGLAASGWHICAMTMRMMADGLLARAASLGAPGVEDCRWMRPVRPGDVLRVEAEVLETRASASRPEMGFVRVRWNVFNQREQVASMISTPMFRRRGGA